MPRKCKGIHTCPENAGPQNFPEGYIEKRKDPNNTMAKLLPIWTHGKTNLQKYKGKWTDEELEEEITQYFYFTVENEVKPAKAGLSLWLSASDETMNAWENNLEKYGRKSVLIREANKMIESSYVERGESYPTFNMFLLKTMHKYREGNEITINHQPISTKEEIAETIEKLGLAD